MRTKMRVRCLHLVQTAPSAHKSDGVYWKSEGGWGGGVSGCRRVGGQEPEELREGVGDWAQSRSFLANKRVRVSFNF